METGEVGQIIYLSLYCKEVWRQEKWDRLYTYRYTIRRYGDRRSGKDYIPIAIL